MLPAASDKGTGFPPTSTTIAPLIVMGTLAVVLAGNTVNVAVATGPSGITVVFIPQIKQVADKTP